MGEFPACDHNNLAPLPEGAFYFCFRDNAAAIAMLIAEA
jgi:hypothetical protein